MKRSYYSFPVKDTTTIKQQMLSWANRFNICCFMDNHDYPSNHHSVECLVGVGAISIFEPKGNTHLLLDDFYASTNDWIFGHFNYGFNHPVEHLPYSHPDYISFPEVFLFVPEILIKLVNTQITIGVITDDPDVIFEQISSIAIFDEPIAPIINLQSRMSRDEYLKTIGHLMDHIKRGDCYEINFCQEFYAEKAMISPIQVYQQLAALSPNPFAAYYRLNDKYLLCASPERYLKKTANEIISQPIKGTWQRNLADSGEDIQNRQLLFESTKDRTENVMVVDLVRNDLSQVCEQGSVHVEELFGIYSFPQVYQMISTVAGTLQPGIKFSEILTATFPMGSMTGAPKRRVMELIEQFEQAKRGIFSGTVGYITPEKDFDFNVVIRSIMYNADTDYLSYQVGSAITSQSIAEDEYDECLLKAKAVNEVLGWKQ